MSIVVTGASGHVGANLVRELIRRGSPPRVLVHRDRRALEGLDLDEVQADLLDPEALRAAFEGARVVYHLAARIDVLGAPDVLTQQTNVEGTRNVVSACLEQGVKRLVHFSSIHALRALPLDQPLDEHRPLADGPDDMPYDRTKALAEREVLAGVERGLDAVILNPTSILGPLDFKPSYMGQVLVDVVNRRLPALIRSGFDWVDVRDVVQCALAAEQHGIRGERYLLGGRWASFGELAASMQAIVGKPLQRWASPLWLARIGLPFIRAYCRIRGVTPFYDRNVLRVLRASHRDIRCDKAAAQLGHKPRPLRQTLADTLAWFVEAGQLPPFQPGDPT